MTKKRREKPPPFARKYARILVRGHHLMSALNDRTIDYPSNIFLNSAVLKIGE